MSLKDSKINLPCLCRFINIYKTNQKLIEEEESSGGGIQICLIEEIVICHNRIKDIVLIQGYTYVIFEQSLETRPHLINFFHIRDGFSVLKLPYLWNGNWRNDSVTLAAEYCAGFGYADVLHKSLLALI